MKKNFPSSQIAFFQFGAILLSVNDLENLSAKPLYSQKICSNCTISQRFKLVLPVRNIVSESESSLINSTRKAIYDFFSQKRRFHFHENVEMVHI